MTYEQAKEIALEKGFGPRALRILLAASRGPVNPWAHFGHELRRSWGYAYFDRLHAAGLLRSVETPAGRRGTRWYTLAGEEGV